MTRNLGKKEFYGTTVLGEKGQVVVPVEARKAINIKKREKLLVFGMNKKVLLFVKADNLEKILSHLSAHLEGVKKNIKKTKG